MNYYILNIEQEWKIEMSSYDVNGTPSGHHIDFIKERKVFNYSGNPMKLRFNFSDYVKIDPGSHALKPETLHYRIRSVDWKEITEDEYNEYFRIEEQGDAYFAKLLANVILPSDM
jgi:hypothetical protein